MKTIKELTKIRLAANEVNKFENVNNTVVKISDFYEIELKQTQKDLIDFCFINNGNLGLGMKIGVYLGNLDECVIINSLIESNLLDKVNLSDKEHLTKFLELESDILEQIKKYESNSDSNS